VRDERQLEKDAQMTQRSLAALSLLELDALREVTHVGCGAAAKALSQMMGDQVVEVEVVQSAVLDSSALQRRLGQGGARLWGVQLSFDSGIEGKLGLVFSEQDAMALATLLTGDPKNADKNDLSELGRSALAELGNIMASAFLSAVGSVTGMILLPSVPTLVSGSAEEISKGLRPPGSTEEPFLLLETQLSTEAPAPFRGHLMIAPADASVGTLLTALGL